MEMKEKLELVADILEEDVADLNQDTVLADLDNWDSVAALSIMAMIDEQFGKEIMASEIRKMRTLGELLAVME